MNLKFCLEISYILTLNKCHLIIRSYSSSQENTPQTNLIHIESADPSAGIVKEKGGKPTVPRLLNEFPFEFIYRGFARLSPLRPLLILSSPLFFSGKVAKSQEAMAFF